MPRSNRPVLYTSMVILLGVATIVPSPRPTSAREYSDVDWNTIFYDNCRLPVPQATDDRPPSVYFDETSRDTKLRFRLDAGDVGGCSSDKTPRSGAKFWERAELHQSGSLERGYAYQIYFSAAFPKGFLGQRETFFQIQNWSKTCRAAPVAMLQFDRKALKLKLLERGKGDGPSAVRGRLRNALSSPPTISDLGSDTHKFLITLDLKGTPTVSLDLDWQSVLPPTPVYVQNCSDPYVKIGIYRPGGVNPGRSELVIDDLQITREPDAGFQGE